MTFDPIKDPDAVLDYKWDWTAWLQTGETITDVTWIIPDTITKDSDEQTATTATIWLSGGTTDADITCRIITNQGRTDDRTQRIYIRQR